MELGSLLSFPDSVMKKHRRARLFSVAFGRPHALRSRHKKFLLSRSGPLAVMHAVVIFAVEHSKHYVFYKCACKKVQDLSSRW